MASQFALVQCVGNYMTIYMKPKQPIKRIKLGDTVYYPERTCKRVQTKYREKRCQIEWECGRCGFPLYSDHDSFCSECGAKVE